MAKSIRELEVFIASPGDVESERQVVRAAVDEVNHIFAREDVEYPRLIATGWEDLTPAFGRAQQNINALVSSCDVFVGVLANRFGSPTGTHPSGFLEEYEGAVSRRDREGSPEIALYFRLPSKAMLEDPGAELQRVLDFKKKVREGHVALYGEFETLSEFENQLKNLLISTVVRNRHKPTEPEGSASGGTAPVVAANPELNGARAQIGRTLEAYMNVVRGSEPDTEHLDRDRLLLFALVFQGSNEEIPVHTINRLYLKRKTLVLADGERALCLEAVAREQLSDELHAVRPGWFMVSSGGRRAWSEVMSEIVGLLAEKDSSVVNGALGALTRGAYRPTELWDSSLDKDPVLLWKAVVSPLYDPRVLASYLLEVAVASDMEFLSRVASEVEAHKDVFDAVLAFLGRDPEALNELVSRNKFNLLEWPKEIVSPHLELLETEPLKEILEWSTDSQLKGRAFQILRDRDCLDHRDWIKACSGAPDSELRSLMLEHAGTLSAGDRASLDEALTEAKILNQGELQGRLRMSADGEQVGSHKIEVDHELWEAISWTAPPSLMNHARHVLRTGGSQYSVQFRTIESAQKVIDFVEAKAREAALRVLERAAPENLGPDDRELVVQEIGKKHWITSEPALDALLSVGTPADMNLIIDEAIAHPYGERSKERLHTAIRSVAKERVLELAKHPDESVSVAAVQCLIAHPSSTSDSLMEFLYSDHSATRIAALKAIVDRSSRCALESLLENYPQNGPGEAYFYNVVVLLDRYLYGPDSAKGGSHDMPELSIKQS